MQKQINKIYGNAIPYETLQLGKWAGSQTVAAPGPVEGMRNALISLNGYSQRFPCSVMLPCSSIYFFFVITQEHFKDIFRKGLVPAVPSCTAGDFE